MVAATTPPFHCIPHKKNVDASNCTSNCPGYCHGPGKMWVVAAAEGRIALYEKLAHGGADLIPIGQSITPQSLEALAQFLRQAYAQKQYEQLLIIGSPNDVCWVQSLLPEEVAGCVVAEIRYTLLPSWFQHTPHMPELTHALNNVLVAR